MGSAMSDMESSDILGIVFNALPYFFIVPWSEFMQTCSLVCLSLQACNPVQVQIALAAPKKETIINKTKMYLNTSLRYTFIQHAIIELVRIHT